LHGLAAVVAGDVGVKVLPDALDTVRVGAVGWQEVQDDPAAELFEGALRRAGGVDAVVVDDEVDALDLGSVVLGELPQQLAEERGALVSEARRVERAGADVERAGEVELLVLA